MPRIPAFLSPPSLPAASSPADPSAPPRDWRSRLARASRTLVATDFDGTLAPIVDDPSCATPLPGAIEALSALAARRDIRVAVVSGRTLTDLRARCPVPGCWYVGGHGNETGAGAGDHLDAESAPRPGAQQIRRLLASLADQLRQAQLAWPGTRLEVKPFSLAVHFRQAPRWKDAILDTFSSYARAGELRVLQGRQVVELLPADALTKGHAIERLRHRLECDLAFYFGDDTTDEDVFRLADPALIGVKVESAENARPTSAAYRIASPHDVLLALRQIAELRQAGTRIRR